MNIYQVYTFQRHSGPLFLIIFWQFPYCTGCCLVIPIQFILHKKFSPSIGNTKRGLVYAFQKFWGFLLDYCLNEWLNTNCIQRLPCLSLIPKNGINFILQNWIRFQDWATLYNFNKISAKINTTFIGFFQILIRMKLHPHKDSRSIVLDTKNISQFSINWPQKAPHLYDITMLFYNLVNMRPNSRDESIGI